MRRSNTEPTITTPSSRGQPREALGGGAGDRLGQVEQLGILFAAEVLRAEQLLQADDLRAAAGRLADAPLGLGQVLVGIERAGHLDQAHAEFGIAAQHHCSGAVS